MGIDPSTMVSLLDELEAARLAKRRPHPADRRARQVVSYWPRWAAAMPYVASSRERWLSTRAGRVMEASACSRAPLPRPGTGRGVRIDLAPALARWLSARPTSVVLHGRQRNTCL